MGRKAPNNFKGENILAISKEEAAYLRERFGDRVYITKPTKHGKRYVCEADYVKRALNEFNGRKDYAVNNRSRRRDGKRHPRWRNSNENG